jgi:hypothetical protein
MTRPPQWPHPTVRVSVTEVADLLKVSRTTLSKPVARVRAGQPARTRKRDIEIAAGIFAAQAMGPTPRVEAGALIEALGIPPSRVARTPPPPEPPKEHRQRLGKKEIAELPELSPQDLYGVFQESAERVAGRNNINARRRLHETIQVMIKRGLSFPVDVIIGEGVKPERFRPFATLADWITHATPKDSRLFVFIGSQRRPIDYPLAPKRALRNATFKFLTLDDWLKAMKRGLAREHAIAEQDILTKATGKAKQPKPPYKRA